MGLEDVNRARAERTHTIQNSKLASLARIGPIFGNRGQCPSSREHLAGLVETPLRSALLKLYDKRILTTESSANGQMLVARFSLDWDSLSDENQRTALRCGGRRFEDFTNQVQFQIETKPDTPVREIANWASQIESQFVRQPMTWAAKKDIDQVSEMINDQYHSVDLEKFLGGKKEMDLKQVKQFLEECYPDGVFDLESETFYFSKAHFELERAPE